MNFIAAGLPLKIVALLDVSKTADAMISDGSVTAVKDLKGKQVAYEEGTTSDILLNYALGQNGMTVADIQKVPMPAADAGSALIAGKVPVAVTYEPYLTLAMQQSPKVKMIYSAGENPGLISDVFVVREEFLKDKPGQIVALLKAWDLALADYRKDTAGGRAIISQAVGAKSRRSWPLHSAVSSITRSPRTERAQRQLRTESDPRGARGGTPKPTSCRRMSTSPGDRRSLCGCGNEIAGKERAVCSGSAGG